MIIYSVTINLDMQIAGEWITWMLEKHIPDVISTGYFQGWHMSRLVEPQPEPNTLTFNIQYECKDLPTYYAYRDLEAPRLQALHNDKFQNRFVAFRTILERI
jgi:hypothetical protein